MKTYNPMEQMLFTWEGWDHSDMPEFQYYNIRTIVQIGDNPPFASFDIARINLDSSTLELQNGDDVQVYALSFKVGELIK